VTKPAVLNLLKKRDQNGGLISLMHDRYPTTLELTKYTIEKAKQLKYKLVDINTCLGI
jgi:hypothetical protein